MATKAVTDSAEDWKWEVKSAADNLMRAEEVKRDPKLYAAAKKELGTRVTDAKAALRKLAATEPKRGR